MFLEIAKYLALHKIEVTLNFNPKKNQYYWDLNTQAKSDLLLYEDLTLEGRYGYTSKLDHDTIEDNIQTLCYEVLRCKHGRDYISCAWSDLCRFYKISS
jgi:hypothetical protein